MSLPTFVARDIPPRNAQPADPDSEAPGDAGAHGHPNTEVVGRGLGRHDQPCVDERIEPGATGMRTPPP